jgi:transcriptional regulator with PAS, ATPase and Fis domain
MPAPTPAAEFRWQAFFQRTGDALFVLDRHRRLLFVNRAWEDLTGLSADRVRGLVCTRRPPAAPSPCDEVTHALSPPPEVLRGHSARVRRCLPAAAGVRHCWDVEFLPFRGEHGTLGVLGKIVPAPGGDPSGVAPLPAKAVALRAALAGRYGLDGLAGEGPAQARLVEQVRLAAESRAAALLVGAPGTGKRWLARVIHNQGPGRERSFAAVDCPRLPPAALAFTLFGEGGLVRRAAVGTLYLREPGALPRDLQARLVEVLADPAPDGPRLLAGTAADLDEEVRSGRLLEELRYGLTTLVLTLTPLRQRPADLPMLVERLLEQTAADDDRRPLRLTPEAWECLRAYSWPGNLRELRSALLSARLHATGETIDAGDLPGYLRVAVQLGPTPGPREERALPLAELLEKVERRLIGLALDRARGNRSRAAELLALWRPRLLRRMEALGFIEKEES